MTMIRLSSPLPLLPWMRQHTPEQLVVRDVQFSNCVVESRPLGMILLSGATPHQPRYSRQPILIQTLDPGLEERN